jgi:hypothetical protein
MQNQQRRPTDGSDFRSPANGSCHMTATLYGALAALPAGFSYRCSLYYNDLRNE